MSPSHFPAHMCVILTAVTSLEQSSGEDRTSILFQIRIRHLTIECNRKSSSPWASSTSLFGPIDLSFLNKRYIYYSHSKVPVRNHPQLASYTGMPELLAPKRELFDITAGRCLTSSLLLPLAETSTIGSLVEPVPLHGASVLPVLLFLIWRGSNCKDLPRNEPPTFL
jgi:hypothetical protein